MNNIKEVTLKGTLQLPRIYFVDINPEMTAAWQKEFDSCDSIEIHNISFGDFMVEHPDIEGIVSPGNSYGLMTGGYDSAISEHFGAELYSLVQEQLLNEYIGEQPVGTCMIVDIPDKGKKLLHTPSMRTPEVLIDSRIVYQCMRSTLVVATQNHLKDIIVPAFGGLTGGVPYSIIAKLMYMAYEDVRKRINRFEYNTEENIFTIRLSW